MKVFTLLLILSSLALASEENQKLTAEGVRVLTPLATEAGQTARKYFDSLTEVERAIVRHQLVALLKLRMTNGERLLNQVERALVIRGTNEKGSCGGLDHHRILWVFKRPLRELKPEVKGLGPSKDLNPPHPGTDLSYETEISRPGMQFHAYMGVASESQLKTLSERFEIALEKLEPFGDRLVEADIDYDWLHRSNPTCMVRSVKGSVGHWLLFFVPMLFAEPAERRFRKQWGEGSLSISSFQEVTY